MDVQRLSVETADGRSLVARVTGPEDGALLVFHNGTPSGGHPFRAIADAATERGLRMATYARPGYGDSTRHPGRAVADCASDAERVAERLGTGRFLTVGWSGGGPHALACAALFPERVPAAATIAGVAPWGADGLDWLAGMGTENVEEFEAALKGPEELRAHLERFAPELATATEDGITAALGDLLSDVDRAALTGELAAFLVMEFREAVRNGIWGWFDDDVAFTRDWGFELSSIRVPVTVWQGVQDRMVPFAHGEWLAANIPGVRPRLEAEHGHLSLPVDSIDRIVDDLIASAEG